MISSENKNVAVTTYDGTSNIVWSKLDTINFIFTKPSDFQTPGPPRSLLRLRVHSLSSTQQGNRRLRGPTGAAFAGRNRATRHEGRDSGPQTQRRGAQSGGSHSQTRTRAPRGDRRFEQKHILCARAFCEKYLMFLDIPTY